jgi:hypothetical protein
MRIVIGIAVVVLLGLGAYFFQWNKQAEIYKSVLLQHIETINAGPEADNVDFTIAYESIGVSGFPFAHRVELVNPKVTSKFTFGALLQWLEGKGVPAGQNNDDTPIEDVFSLDGTLTAGINYLSSSGEMEMDGMLTGQDTIMGETIAWEMHRDGPATCRIDFLSKASWALVQTYMLGKPVPAEEFTRYLNSVRCNVPAQKVIRAGSDELLASSGDAVMAVTDIDLTDREKISLHLITSIPDASIRDAYAKFYGSIGSGLPPSQYQLNPLEQFDVVGAQSMSIDLLFTMRDPGLASKLQNGVESVANNPEYVLFDMKDFSLSNKLYSLKIPMFLEMDKQEDTMTLKLRSNAENKVENEFDLAVGTAISEGLKDPVLAQQFSAVFPEASSEEAQAFVLEVLPHLSGFGAIKTNTDIEASMSATSPAASGGVTVRALDFLTDVYSLKIQGSYDLSKTEGLANIECLQCDKMVADMVEYNNRFQRALVAIDTTHRPTIISPEFYEGIMLFLRGLNTGKDQDNITMAVVSDGQGNITISGKPVFQVMMEAMQLFQPLMSSPPSAAQ